MKKSYPTNQTPKWVKITVHLKLGIEDPKKWVHREVYRFESEFHIKLLYFARYTNLESSTFEISAFTDADWNSLRRFFRMEGVLKVEIIDRGSGSLAHAHAYQAVKKIKPFEQDTANDDEFLDVLHWMCNMRGLDYVREARLYSYGALRFLHQIALESEENAKIMRRFNAKVKTSAVAESLVERLNLLGRGRAKAKPSPRDPPPKPKRSYRAASGKAHGSSGSRSSGSARR